MKLEDLLELEVGLYLKVLVFIPLNIEVRNTKEEKGKKRQEEHLQVLPVQAVLLQVVQPAINDFMKPVNIGIVGCGVIGKVHIETSLKSSMVNVVAVSDIKEELAKKAAETYGIKKWYNSGEKLIDDNEVEGVILGFPARNRHLLAIYAMHQGKHVLLEKPAATCTEEIYQMIKARKNLVCASFSSRFRFLESAKFVTEFIEKGGLGDIRIVFCRVLYPPEQKPDPSPPPWRVSKALNGGGILVNWGCYDLDYLLGLTGWDLKPELVVGQTWEIPPQFQHYVAPGSDAEEHFAAFIRCKGGSVIIFERGERVPSSSQEVWQITGIKGTLHLKLKIKEYKEIIFDNNSTEKLSSDVIWKGKEDNSKVHSGPIEDFAIAIRKKQKPKTGLEEALIIQKITDAIYKSAEQSKAISID